MLTVVFYFFLATQMAAARGKFGVKLPATSGHPDFDRVARVHGNTLEWLPIFLPLLWLCAVYTSDRVAAALGMLWLVGRVAYWRGYSTAVEKRLPRVLHPVDGVRAAADLRRHRDRQAVERAIARQHRRDVLANSHGLSPRGDLRRRRARRLRVLRHRDPLEQIAPLE